jgi:uncharacterized protein YihD (DUF1040 family)
MSNFTIDFFELAFLAEACIPPRPIARAMFWQSLTSRYWNEMSENERIHMFEWLNKNSTYQESLSRQEEDTLIFHARFDPNNQYEVTAIDNGIERKVRTFLYEGRYWVSNRSFVDPDRIVNIEKKYYVTETVQALNHMMFLITVLVLICMGLFFTNALDWIYDHLDGADMDKYE